MSRSYRKNLIITDGQDGGKARKMAKRRANKSVKHTKEISNGGSYKKEFESWNICDWKFIYDETSPWAWPRWKVRMK